MSPHWSFIKPTAAFTQNSKNEKELYFWTAECNGIISDEIVAVYKIPFVGRKAEDT